jgi:hypothetical protein
MGVDPVANPSTAGLFYFCFARINEAISKATASAISLLLSKIRVGTFSKEPVLWLSGVI